MRQRVEPRAQSDRRRERQRQFRHDVCRPRFEHRRVERILFLFIEIPDRPPLREFRTRPRSGRDRDDRKKRIAKAIAVPPNALDDLRFVRDRFRIVKALMPLARSMMLPPPSAAIPSIGSPANFNSASQISFGVGLFADAVTTRTTTRSRIASMSGASLQRSNADGLAKRGYANREEPKVCLSALPCS